MFKPRPHRLPGTGAKIDDKIVSKKDKIGNLSECLYRITLFQSLAVSIKLQRLGLVFNGESLHGCRHPALNNRLFLHQRDREHYTLP
jgi:hypothetical protein